MLLSISHATICNLLSILLQRLDSDCSRLCRRGRQPSTTTRSTRRFAAELVSPAWLKTTLFCHRLAQIGSSPESQHALSDRIYCWLSIIEKLSSSTKCSSCLASPRKKKRGDLECLDILNYYTIWKQTEKDGLSFVTFVLESIFLCRLSSDVR